MGCDITLVGSYVVVVWFAIGSVKDFGFTGCFERGVQEGQCCAARPEKLACCAAEAAWWRFLGLPIAFAFLKLRSSLYLPNPPAITARRPAKAITKHVRDVPSKPGSRLTMMYSIL